MDTAVIFGAGSVGRGFIGQLFSESGLQVVFVDVVPEIIEGINRQNSYPHITVSNRGREQTIICNVRAVHSADEAKVIEAITDARIMATSVGANILPRIAGSLARGLEKRLATGRPPINVLLCENLHGAASFMREQLSAHLAAATATAVLDNTGLLETSIGRMIPVPSEETRAIHPAAVCVEPYKFLPYDAKAVKGEMPAVAGLVGDLTVPFAFYSDRKLYIHNLGHCLCAYLGEMNGDVFIADAIHRPAIRYLVRAAMLESALALAAHYGQAAAGLVDHIDNLLARFGNRELQDTVERVGRDPARKMAAGDRFLGAFQLACETGGPKRYLTFAVAVGLNKLSQGNGWTAEQWQDYLRQVMPSFELDEKIMKWMSCLGDSSEIDRLIELIDEEMSADMII